MLTHVMHRMRTIASIGGSSLIFLPLAIAWMGKSFPKSVCIGCKSCIQRELIQQIVIKLKPAPGFSHLRLPDVVPAGPVVILFPSDSDEEGVAVRQPVLLSRRGVCRVVAFAWVFSLLQGSSICLLSFMEECEGYQLG